MHRRKVTGNKAKTPYSLIHFLLIPLSFLATEIILPWLSEVCTCIVCNASLNFCQASLNFPKSWPAYNLFNTTSIIYLNKETSISKTGHHFYPLIYILYIIYILHVVNCVFCAGYFSQISTLADVQENVMRYLHVMSRPKVIDHEHDTVWTEAYVDSAVSVNFMMCL